ncbi:hypothetical protein BJV82DRAFT_573580 [Fennellomyces sp. T-0311]|nr:hypothetical protein BJV82DRAFT_573580 [Fennellomyces sp. T-0311]
MAKVVNSGHGIDVIAETLHPDEAPQVAAVNNSPVTVYLLPHDPLDHGNDISEYVRIVVIPYGLVDTAGIEIVRRPSDDDSKVKCRLQVVLPPALEFTNQDEPKTSLRAYHVSIKKGQIRARGITADRMSRIAATVGLGSVEFSSIEVYSMTVAVIDGIIHLPGVKFTRELTAGVFRGSSTVLAKLQHSGLGYYLTNMCADGCTYTDTMLPIVKENADTQLFHNNAKTSPDSIDGLAANYYIYRDTGGPAQDSYEPRARPRPPGDIYTGDDELLYLDEHSTEVNKTGYWCQKTVNRKF